MSNAFKWVAGLSAALAVTSAMMGGCSGNKDPLAGGGDDGGGSGNSGSSSGGFGGTNNGGSSGFSSGASTATTTDENSGPCKGGHYGGTFAGSYTSHLTGVGFPIPVTGNVELNLDQEGTADMMCHSGGEIPVPCNDVFS